MYVCFVATVYSTENDQNILIFQSWRDPSAKSQRRTPSALRGHYRHPPVLSTAQEARAHIQSDDPRRGEFKT
jgi:hypothetical protein